VSAQLLKKTGPETISRRTLLVSAAAAACGRKPGKRYQGWLFVSSAAERAIIVANLADFRRMTTVPLPASPNQLFHSPAGVFASSLDGRALIGVDLSTLHVQSRIGLNGRPIVMRLLQGGEAAVAALDDPPALVVADLVRRRVSARLPLPAAPADLDVNGDRAVLSIPARGAILRVSIDHWRTEGITDIGEPCGTVRFRNDGRTILGGAPAAHEIVILDAASGVLLARLPLPISPRRFCFNADGGQMFVTGEGEDTVAIVDPYQNEVGETMLAGRTPHAMAVSERMNLLFVTNYESGDLTILDIYSRRLSASVHVGENPGEVLITPDGEYALVVDQRSGNVSVVRVTTVLDHKVRIKPLFTVFPTAADPQSAIIVPRSV
jgi:YVTN family beta-propeller protein